MLSNGISAAQAEVDIADVDCLNPRHDGPVPTPSSAVVVARLEEGLNEARRGAGLMLCVALTLLSLLPALNVLFPVGTLLAERLLFMPSVGFCIGNSSSSSLYFALSEIYMQDSLICWWKMALSSGLTSTDTSFG